MIAARRARNSRGVMKSAVRPQPVHAAAGGTRRPRRRAESLFDVFRPAKDIVEAFGRRLTALAENRPVLPPVPPDIDYVALLDDTKRH